MAFKDRGLLHRPPYTIGTGDNEISGTSLIINQSINQSIIYLNQAKQPIEWTEQKKNNEKHKNQTQKHKHKHQWHKLRTTPTIVNIHWQLCITVLKLGKPMLSNIGVTLSYLLYPKKTSCI